MTGVISTEHSVVISTEHSVVISTERSEWRNLNIFPRADPDKKESDRGN